MDNSMSARNKLDMMKLTYFTIYSSGNYRLSELKYGKEEILSNAKINSNTLRNVKPIHAQ